MKKQLDPYTFGDSDAAITLAKILSQEGNEKHCSNASRRYCEFCRMVNVVRQIKDRSDRASLLNMLMKDFRSRVSVSSLPEDVQSYLLNVANKIYKEDINYCQMMILGDRANEKRLNSFEKSIDNICEPCGGKCCVGQIEVFPSDEIYTDNALTDGFKNCYSDRVMKTDGDNRCVALLSGKCSIYEKRPFICRKFKVNSKCCKKFQNNELSEHRCIPCKIIGTELD